MKTLKALLIREPPAR